MPCRHVQCTRYSLVELCFVSSSVVWKVTSSLDLHVFVGLRPQVGTCTVAVSVQSALRVNAILCKLFVTIYDSYLNRFMLWFNLTESDKKC
jgi:hypothetical protein